MRTLAAYIGGEKSPYIRTGDTPHYRKMLSQRPVNATQQLRVVIEDTGEIVYCYNPPKNQNERYCKDQSKRAAAAARANHGADDRRSGDAAE